MKENKNITWKSFALSLLYPHPAIIICLFPISVSFLVFALINLETKSLFAIISYLLAFYVLLLLSLKIPKIITFFKKLKKENKYLQKWFSDIHLRINVSLYASLVWNIAFAIFQLGLGFYYKSFWFYSLFAYYIFLGIMRFFLVKHTRKYKVNERKEIELKKYIFSGWLLLLMNIALSVIVFFIVYWNRTFEHHMITTIAMASYTFFTFTFAIIDIIRFKKYKSPVYSAAKTISLISGAVSMLTLETTMLTTFGAKESKLFNQIMLSLTGVAVIGFAIITAIIMITKGKKQLKKLQNATEIK